MMGTVDLDAMRTVVALVVLASLCASVIVALVFIASSLRSVSYNTARVHRQQANIIGMLLRAGFRPSKSGRDWFEDANETRVKGDGERFDTQWDMRPPTD